jgi:acyl carrier protein
MKFRNVEIVLVVGITSEYGIEIAQETLESVGFVDIEKYFHEPSNR